MVVLLRVLADAALPWRATWPGALLGGLALSVMTHFGGQLVALGVRNPVFGALVGVVGLLFWLSLVAKVVLLAAAFAAVGLAPADEGAPRTARGRPCTGRARSAPRRLTPVSAHLAGLPAVAARATAAAPTADRARSSTRTTANPSTLPSPHRTGAEPSASRAAKVTAVGAEPAGGILVELRPRWAATRRRPSRCRRGRPAAQRYRRHQLPDRRHPAEVGEAPVEERRGVLPGRLHVSIWTMRMVCPPRVAAPT